MPERTLSTQNASLFHSGSVSTPRATPPYTDAPSRLVVRCQDHPTYRGLSAPREQCPSCEVVHQLRGATTTLREDENTRYSVRVGSA